MFIVASWKNTSIKKKIIIPKITIIIHLAYT